MCDGRSCTVYTQANFFLSETLFHNQIRCMYPQNYLLKSSYQSVRRKFRSAKFPTAKISFGENSVGEYSFGENSGHVIILLKLKLKLKLFIEAFNTLRRWLHFFLVLVQVIGLSRVMCAVIRWLLDLFCSIFVRKTILVLMSLCAPKVIVMLLWCQT